MVGRPADETFPLDRIAFLGHLLLVVLLRLTARRGLLRALGALRVGSRGDAVLTQNRVGYNSDQQRHKTEIPLKRCATVHCSSRSDQKYSREYTTMIPSIVAGAQKPSE